VYSLLVTQTCRVVIETITDGDTVMRIYNEAGNFLGEDDDSGAASREPCPPAPTTSW